MFKKLIVSGLMLVSLGMGVAQLALAATTDTCQDACQADYELCLDRGYSQWQCDKAAIACWRNC